MELHPLLLNLRLTTNLMCLFFYTSPIHLQAYQAHRKNAGLQNAYLQQLSNTQQQTPITSRCTNADCAALGKTRSDAFLKTFRARTPAQHKIKRLFPCQIKTDAASLLRRKLHLKEETKHLSESLPSFCQHRLDSLTHHTVVGLLIKVIQKL